MSVPNLPDGLYKLFFYLGVLIIIYAVYEGKETQEASRNALQLYKAQVTELEPGTGQVIQKELKEAMENLKTDMGLALVHGKSSSLADLDNATEKLEESRQTFALKQHEFDIDNIAFQREYRKSKVLLETVQETFKQQKQAISEFPIFLFIGGAAILFGLGGLQQTQTVQDELLKRQLNEKDEYYAWCQSCGKNFTAITEYGVKKDGTLNKAFCSKCYLAGAFTEPDLTLASLQKRIFDTYSKKLNFFTKRKLSLRLSNLARWKSYPFG